MLEIGMKLEQTRVVTEEDSAARISPRVPPVYASARMIGFAELVCADLMAPHLAPGETSVGVGFQFTHEAATPIGMKVTLKATLTAIENKKYVFEIEGRDEADRICVGRHERAVIKLEKFMARLGEKAKRLPPV